MREADSLVAEAEDEHDFTWHEQLQAFIKNGRRNNGKEKVSEKKW